MDIFAELEKLRMPTHECEEAMGFSGEKCHCGNHEHNETLGGIIEWMKSPKQQTKGRFGCHFHNIYPISNYCALDDNDDKDHCCHASRLYDQGKPKTDCFYWKEIK